MRSAMMLPLLLLAGCQVTKDGNNDSVTVEYNQDVAENGAEAVANTASDIASDIGNDVTQTADKVQNKVGDVDVDVDVNRNAPANANEGQRELGPTRTRACHNRLNEWSGRQDLNLRPSAPKAEFIGFQASPVADAKWLFSQAFCVQFISGLAIALHKNVTRGYALGPSAMVKTLLTDSKIRALKASPGDRHEYPDSVVDGLRLRVSNRSKTWALRLQGGRQGPHGDHRRVRGWPREV